jgi:hypothetical protein
VHFPPAPDDPRCYAQALIQGQWKRCIQSAGHLDRRHVWLESFDRVGGRPVVVTWTAPREVRPVVAEVSVPKGLTNPTGMLL